MNTQQAQVLQLQLLIVSHSDNEQQVRLSTFSFHHCGNSGGGGGYNTPGPQ